MKNHLTKLELIMRENVTARSEYRAAKAKLEAQRDTFNREFLDTKARELSDSLRRANENAYHKAVEVIAAMTEAAQAKHDDWQHLDSVKLSNALKVIELSGGKLDALEVRRLNQQFKGDVPALKALQAIYASRGIYDGGIDKMLYSPDEAQSKLSAAALDTFHRDGSLNRMARSVSEFAALEGENFPTLIDEQGADMELRAAAGLQ